MIALPDTFNAASWFIDRNVAEGRGPKVAIECGDQRITYAEVLERVNRAGNMLRDQFEVRIEERVVLLLLDGPEFIYTFFGAVKIGAVPIPTSTLWKTADYEYVLNDSRARVIVISAHEGIEWIRQAFDAGVQAVLYQDMLRTELLSAIRAVHASRQYIPKAIASRLEK